MKYTFYIFILISLISFPGYSQDKSPEEGISLQGDALFGAIRARHIGPALMSGRVTDLEGHPTDAKILYVGSAGGGVWKTSDGGVTFKPIFDDYCQSIGAVAVDPNDPDNTIWVGTGEIWTRNSVSIGDGLYRSTDGGKNWKLMGFEKSDRISSIQINPNNSNEIYVGVLGALWGDSDERGIYKTMDGGETWDKIKYIDNTTGCSDLFIDPKNPSTLYASFWEFRRTGWSFSSGGDNSALYKSVDSGATWNKIHNGFPAGKLGRIAVAVAPSDPSILYTAIEAEKKENSGLYKSIDGGKNWTFENKDFGLVVRPFYFSRLVVSPHNPDFVVKAGLFGSVSEDGGKTFRQIGSGVHPDFHDFWFDIKDPDRMYVGTDGGTYRSWDGGTVWEMVKGLPLSQFYHVTTDNAIPFNVYGGLQDNGSWVGPSSSPAGVEAGDWTSVGYGDGFRVYPHPANPDICYSEMQGAESIWRVNISKNQSTSIQPFQEDDVKLRFNWNPPIATSMHNDNRVFVGSQFLHRSDDNGDSWTIISEDLTTNDPAKQNQEESGGLSKDNSGAENHCTIFTIAESPLDQNVIWVGTDDGNVQVTMNGGKSWKNVTENLGDIPANTWCYHIEPSSFSKETAYAVFDGHTSNDMNTYVMKTTDGGQSWQSIVTDDIVGFARSIQEDYVNPDLLYLGTELGLYVTIDGGVHWSKFTNNMPSVAVHHVTLHKRDHALVMGTHGRGVIIIDDVRPLRQLTKGFIAEKVNFIDMGPQMMKEGGSFGGTSTYGEFVGQNKNQSAKIVYYLNKRHTFGKMKLEIFDANNKRVASLAPGKSKGLNIVDWSHSYKMPKIAKAKTFTFGGFGTPNVLPGKYKVVMTKGKQVYESEIELVYDDQSIHSDADRKLQHDTAMEMYDMNEELAYVIDNVNTIHDAGAKYSDHTDMELAKLAKKSTSTIDSYKENLVILTGDNYVGAAEPQLREKIARLYGQVVGSAGKPSMAQMINLKDLKASLKKAIDEYQTIAKLKDEMNTLLEKNELDPISLRTKEEFLASNK